MNRDYEQLCGALGLLASHGAELDRPAITANLRAIACRLGNAHESGNMHDPVYVELRQMHRHYRDRCLALGLIRPGYLFDQHDADGWAA